MAKKVFVLGIDGMPFTLLHTEYFCRLMPRFTGICKTFGVHKMNSVLPVISSVAWTSFATGQIRVSTVFLALQTGIARLLKLRFLHRQAENARQSGISCLVVSTLL